jgi:hypothetical protein
MQRELLVLCCALATVRVRETERGDDRLILEDNGIKRLASAFGVSVHTGRAPCHELQTSHGAHALMHPVEIFQLRQVHVTMSPA